MTLLQRIKQWFCGHEFTSPQEYDIDSIFGTYARTQIYCDKCFKILSSEGKWILSPEAKEFIHGQPDSVEFML